jgi:hypothetical protein
MPGILTRSGIWTQTGRDEDHEKIQREGNHPQANKKPQKKPTPPIP